MNDLWDKLADMIQAYAYGNRTRKEIVDLVKNELDERVRRAEGAALQLFVHDIILLVGYIPGPDELVGQATVRTALQWRVRQAEAGAYLRCAAYFELYGGGKAGIFRDWANALISPETQAGKGEGKAT